MQTPLRLVIKVDKPAREVRGFVVFKRRNPQVGVSLPISSFIGSLLFSDPSFSRLQKQPVEVEEKLVLQEFEYTDSDRDGIYTADIIAPVVDGEYEIITVIEYLDESETPKAIRLVAVIDPEGYIYEKSGDREIRVPGAIVSLFHLNSETKKYELWQGEEYDQENPQVTRVQGTYSFLVPEGSYYVQVEAPGYPTYIGKPFQVEEGSGVHTNIELKSKYGWLKVADWQTVLLIAIAMLLLFNFYRDKIRNIPKTSV